MNGVIFFISFSENWLLVYRNVIEFCMMFVFRSLLNLFISSTNFLVVSLGFLYIGSCILKTILLFLYDLEVFISSSCLIDLGRTSHGVLNMSGESEHLYPVPVPRERAFKLSPVSIILAM